jgi:YVTN family beta-propeller protein
MTYKKIFAAIIAFSIFSGTSAQDTYNYKVTKTFHIASGGGWDYIAVNNRKLYVSHGTQVNILNELTGDSIGVIPNTNGVHGIAFDNELNKGFTSNGRSNNVTVFDLTTNQVLSQIPAGENPDAILYEPFSKKIITCNGRSNDLSVIDPLSGKVITSVSVGGKPEAAVTNGEGKLYVNIEDRNEIAEINTKTFTVENHWSILPGEGPTGLAFDKKTKRLFAGCDKLLIVVDAVSGKIIDKQTIGDGCDGVVLDNKNRMIFTSNGEGNITAVKEKSADEFSIVQTIPTKRGARTITIDENSHTLFLPTADFEAPDPNAVPNARRKIVPGTFQVLVVQ